MARDFKSSFIIPTQTGAVGGALGCTTNTQQVFRSGLNTLVVTSAGGASTAALTASTSDFFYVDEQNADMFLSNNPGDGTKGEGMQTSASLLGLRIAPTSAVTGLFTLTNHGLAQGQTIVFSSVTGGGGVIRTYRPYIVQYVSANTFYVSERGSTNFLVTATAVSASLAHATNAVTGLGSTAVAGQAGAGPEALVGQYIRPLYLRCVVQPNIVSSAVGFAVNVTNLTLTLSGSYVRGFNGNAGTIADLDAAPYATIASKTFQQTFYSGDTTNLVPNTGAVFTMPFQTDFPFLRCALSFGRTETATGLITSTTSTIGVGLHVVTGRENALV